MSFEFEQIGVVHSPFKEKFGIPRQSGLVPEAGATLELIPPYNRPEAVAGLDGYSHIWLQFVFHQVHRAQWQPTVRPPRLGGNRRVGVFASRSPFRPNPMGLSVVRLESVSVTAGAVSLQLAGVDLLDGTPVLDIKPYISYADSIADARSGFARNPPAIRLKVVFSALAERQLASRTDGLATRRLIEALLQTDPRPAYACRSQQGRGHGIRLYDFDLRWRVREDGVAEVLELVPE